MQFYGKQTGKLTSVGPDGLAWASSERAVQPCTHHLFIQRQWKLTIIVYSQLCLWNFHDKIRYKYGGMIKHLQLTPDDSNLQAKSKKVQVIRSSSYRGMGFQLIPLITSILTGRTDTFCVPKHQETKEIDISKLQCCSIFRKLIQNKFSVMESVLSHYTLTKEVWVIESKIYYEENDLKGIGIHFKLAGGSSYWG